MISTFTLQATHSSFNDITITVEGAPNGRTYITVTGTACGELHVRHDTTNHGTYGMHDYYASVFMGLDCNTPLHLNERQFVPFLRGLLNNNDHAVRMVCGLL